MITQYAVAGANSGAVIGTDHAAENITGFFTKFGDGGADVIPLYRLNKRQGKQLLAELGADPAIYEKIPTADLEENRPGIADEVALGVTYNDIDDYLEGKTVSSEAKEKLKIGGVKQNTNVTYRSQYLMISGNKTKDPLGLFSLKNSSLKL